MSHRQGNIPQGYLDPLELAEKRIGWPDVEEYLRIIEKQAAELEELKAVNAITITKLRHTIRALRERNDLLEHLHQSYGDEMRKLRLQLAELRQKYIAAVSDNKKPTAVTSCRPLLRDNKASLFQGQKPATGMPPLVPKNAGFLQPRKKPVVDPNEKPAFKHRW